MLDTSRRRPARTCSHGAPAEGAIEQMVRDMFRLRRRDRGNGEAILSQQQHALVTEELALLARLSAILDAYPAPEEDKDSIVDAAEQLTSLFLLVIVGEFNAGKSAFINAL